MVSLGEVGGIFFQMDEDAGATRGVGGGFTQFIAFAAIAHPVHGCGLRLPGAGGDLHFVRRHEHAVEAHAVLTDEVLRTALIFLHHLQELFRAGVGDGTQELHHLISGHTDTGIGDGEGASFLIRGDADAQLTFRLVNTGFRQLAESQLLQRIRGIGNQLAHKNLAVTVEGVNHNVQQLPDFSLKLVCLHSVVGKIMHLL